MVTSRIGRKANRFTDLGSRVTSFRCRIALPLHLSPDPTKRIVKIVHHALLQRNNSIIGNLNAFGANLRATFRNIAITDPLLVSQFLDAIFGIERMHLQRGNMNQKPWSDESLVHLVVPQDMADVLTKETFDAFTKFLYTIDVLLLHSPGPI